MPEYLGITLDVATALSIIGAAATFLFQVRHQKRADLEKEKWHFLGQLAEGIRDHKLKIVYAILEKNKMLGCQEVIYEKKNL